jgi:hypothetical protein
LNTVPAVSPAVWRRHRAAVALKLMGIVMPGAAWMLFRTDGRVKLISTKALGVPLTIQTPACAVLGATVAGVPGSTVPKSSP